MLLASSGQRPGVPLSVLQDTRQPLATKNYPAQHASVLRLRKLVSIRWFHYRLFTGKDRSSCNSPTKVLIK